MWSTLREAHNVWGTTNYTDELKFSLTTGVFRSVLSVLEAPRVPPRQQIWTLWDPEQALSQQQHPPLSWRQTSGGQTLLPCNSPHCFLSHLMPSLLSSALPKPHLMFFFCFDSFSRSLVHPTKPRYYTFCILWSQIKALNVLKYLQCGCLWSFFSPYSDWFCFSTLYTISYTETEQG